MSEILESASNRKITLHNVSREKSDLDEELDCLDPVTKVPNCTIENIHTSAIQIIQELLNLTIDIPGILTDYQKGINIKIEDLVQAQ